jgi:hypothetical protein
VDEALPEQAQVLTPVRRMLRTAERVQHRAQRRNRLADAVLQRRMPKLLASATRLASGSSDARAAPLLHSTPQAGAPPVSFERVMMVTAPHPRVSAETSSLVDVDAFA